MQVDFSKYLNLKSLGNYASPIFYRNCIGQCGLNQCRIYREALGAIAPGPPGRAPLQVWNLQVWTVSLSHIGHIVTYYHYYALAELPFNMPMVRK